MSRKNIATLISRRTITEMALIIMLSAVVGIIWNRRMLVDSWTGIVTAPQATSSSPAVHPPLPLGLMQVKELFDHGEGYFLDARDAAAYAQGHIKGARSLPLGESEAGLEGFRRQIPQGTTLIIYCNGYGCHDSMKLGEKLRRAGYGEIYLFEGGYPEWREAGYPVEGIKP